MHEIGHAGEARIIHEWVNGSRDHGRVPSCVVDQVPPKGWRFLGRGSFRSVWESPSGVAYKIEHNWSNYYNQQTAEIRCLEDAWRGSKGIPEGCRIPRFSTYYIGDEPVIAVECIKGLTLLAYNREASHEEQARLEDLMMEAEDALGLADMHDENCMVDEDGILVIVDLGG